MMLTSSSTPMPRRDTTAAVWVAGTGAFLLVAAAAVFVAHRWDQLPDVAKLGIVATMTGVFLSAGRAVKTRLPATGDVIFHLGAFLIPVDVAAVAVHAGLDWRGITFAEGAVGVAVLGGLAVATRSVVLRWTATLSMAVLACGVAALTPVAAPLALAAIAVVAVVAGQRTIAIATASAAGIAPLAGPLALFAGDRVLVELGLAGRGAALSAAASGAIAAVILGREAKARKDMALVAVAALSLVAGGAVSWTEVAPGPRSTALVAGALFVVIELVAMWMVRDKFWRRVTTPLALTTEVTVAAILGLPLAAIASVLLEWTPPVANAELAGACALAVAGWLIASWRRQGPVGSLAGAARRTLADEWTCVPVAVFAVAAVAAGSASSAAIAIALATIALAYALIGGTAATLLTVTAAGLAPGAALLTSRPLALAVAFVATGACALAARNTSDVTLTRIAAVFSLMPIAVGGVAASTLVGSPAATFGTIVAVWLVAASLDDRDRLASTVLRGTMAFPVVVGLAFDSADGAVVTAIAVLLIVLDAIRLDEPLLAIAPAAVVHLAIVQAASAVGIDAPNVGVLLCVAASAPAGLALLLSERWRPPLLTAAISGAAFGLAAASNDPGALATSLLVVGSMGIVAGVALRNLVVGNIGGAVVVVAVALRLVIENVTASEPYVAPACAQLLVLGWLLRRSDSRPSSWVVYAPAVALLGGAAIAERLDGGGGWHAIVAGVVGVAAVAAGGYRRLAGPLFLGTAVLVTITGVESFGYVAGVPTWALLAAGGSALLTTGVSLERSATSPLEAGRRLVDVIGERYE